MTPSEVAEIYAAAFPLSRPWSVSEVDALLRSPGTFLVFHESAFAIGRVVTGEAEIITLACAPADQRRGFGKAVLAKFEGRARDAGATHAFLEVAADNDAGRAMYSSAGYAASGRRPGYYQRGGVAIDALILRKGF